MTVPYIVVTKTKKDRDSFIRRRKKGDKNFQVIGEPKNLDLKKSGTVIVQEYDYQKGKNV